ncbi:preprotein translocase subunit YajC, partial [Dysosmobacter welbionis]
MGRQDVVDVVDAAEGQLDGDGAVDGQGAPAQVQRRGGVVRGGLVMAAFRAAESADVVVVDVVIFHGGMAHRTAGPVVVHAGGGRGVGGAAVQAEPLHPVPSPGKAAGQGIVGVQDQLRLRMEGRENGVIH